MSSDMKEGCLYEQETSLQHRRTRWCTVCIPLQDIAPGTGYFRPVDHTSHGGKRVGLVRDVFRIQTPLEDMVGVTQETAYKLLAADRTDDLVEAVLSGGGTAHVP